jgi:hypothetical protein
MSFGKYLVIILTLSGSLLAQAPSVTLNWTASTTSGVTYNCFRGTASGAESTTPLNGNVITGTTYTDTTVVGGTTYYYTCESVLAGVSSAPSNEASAAVPAVPAAPTGVTATPHP